MSRHYLRDAIGRFTFDGGDTIHVGVNTPAVVVTHEVVKTHHAGQAAGGGGVTDVTIWDRDTRRPVRVEHRAVAIAGLDLVDPASRDTMTNGIHAGLAVYPPAYRVPTVEISKAVADNADNGWYYTTGLKVGTDKIQISPRLVAGTQLVHIVQHENAHRTQMVLRARVEATSGEEAAHQWALDLDRASLAWLDNALTTAPGDPRLEYADLNRRMRARGVQGASDPAYEAFAELLSNTIGGQGIPGDASAVWALVRQADPQFPPAAT